MDPSSTQLWEIKLVELREKRKEVVLNKLEVYLNQSVFVETLKKNARSYFGNRMTSEIVVGPQGDINCFFEGVIKDSYRSKAVDQPFDENPLTVFGFKIQFAVYGSKVNVFLYDHFILGRTSREFMSKALKYAAKSLGVQNESKEKVDLNFRSCRYISLNELEFSLLVPTFRQLSANLKVPMEPKTIEPLLESKTPLSASLTNDNHKRIFEIASSKDGLLRPYIHLAKMPVEVIESHEKAELLSEVERHLIRGDFTHFLEKASPHLNLPLDPYFLKRLSLIALTDFEVPASILDQISHTTSSSDKLVLSAAIHIEKKAHHFTKALDLLSRLGKQFEIDLPDFEGIKSFEVLLPELFGDFWSEENPQKSYLSYQRVVQKRGPNARVLRKMVLVAQKIPNIELELDSLKKLVKVERRHMVLAQFYLRIGQIYKAQKWFQIQGENDPLQYGINALQYQKNNIEIIGFIVDILNDRRQYEAAIQLLDNILNDGALNLEQIDRSKLEQMMGDIWQNGLSRPDLAQARYEHSLHNLGDNIELIESLAKIYGIQGQSHKLATMLERVFAIAHSKRDLVKLKSVFHELFTIYTQNIKNIVKCYKLFVELLDFPELFIGELNCLNILIQNDHLNEINKLILYDALNDLNNDLLSPQKRSQLRTFLGEFAREFLHDQKKSIEQLVKSLQDGPIDASNMAFLIFSLEEQKNYALLGEIYEKYLGYTTDGREQTRILRMMLETPEIFSDERKDSLLIKMIEGDVSHSDLLEKRIESYSSRQYLEGFQRLGSMLLESKMIMSEKKRWIRLIADSLEEFTHPETAMVLDEFFQYQMSFGDEKEPILDHAIRVMRRFKDKVRMRKYLLALLDIGGTPSMSEPEVTKEFQDQEEILSKYYFHMAKTSQEPDLIANFGHKALALLKKSPPNHNLMCVVLGMVGVSSRLSLDELDTFEQYAANHGKWELLAKVLTGQQSFIKEPNQRLGLLNRLADVYSERLGDLVSARSVLEKALKLEMAPLRTLIKLANIAHTQKDQIGEGHYLHVMLKDEGILLQKSELKKIIERLSPMKSMGPKVLETILGHVKSYRQKRMHKEAFSLIEILLENGFVSDKVLMASFREALGLKDLAIIADSWVKVLEYLGKSDAAEDFRKESLKMLNTSNLKDALLVCYRHLMSKNNKDTLHPETYFEIIVSYANLLFHINDHRATAFKLYQEAYQLRPEDDRIWIPYFILIDEFSDDQSRVKILKEIIPQIEVNPRALARYPVTIESLKAQLQKLQDPTADLLPQSQSKAQDAVTTSLVDSNQNNVYSFLNDVNSKNAFLSRSGVFAMGSNHEINVEEKSSEETFKERHLSLVKESSTSSQAPRTQEEAPLFSLVTSLLPALPPTPPADTENLSFESLIDQSAKHEVPSPPLSKNLLEASSSRGPDPVELTLGAELLPEINPPQESPPLEFNLEEPPPPVEPEPELPWRMLVLGGTAEKANVEQALKANFISDTEKHLALQALALVSGEVNLLMEQWKGRVWRNSNEYFYPISSKDRIPGTYTGYKSPILLPVQSLLFRLIQMLSPVLIRIYHERFSIEHLTKVAKIRIESIAKSAQLLDWKSGIMYDVGLHHYADRFKSREIVCYSLKGLNQIVFFDGRDKKIYIDATFYRGLPPTALFHRMVSLLWEIRLNYYVPLALEPKTFIAPVLAYLARRAKEPPPSTVTRLLKSDKNHLRGAILRLDQKVLNDLVEKVGSVQDQQLYALWRAMRLYTRCMMIAETLDLVGTFESITGRDFLQNKLKPGEAETLFTDAKFLLDLVTQLSV